MCMQDIEIGRQTDIRGDHQTIPAVGYYSLPAAWDRLAVSFSKVGAIQASIVVRAKTPSGFIAIASIIYNIPDAVNNTFYSRGDILLRIEEYGHAVTGELRVESDPGVTLGIVEYIAMTDLGNALRREKIG